MTVNEIKFIKKLHLKKHRREEKLFFVEGKKLMDEALHHYPNGIQKIYTTDSNMDKIMGVEVVQISEKEMERISALKSPSSYFTLLKMKSKESSRSSNSIFLEDIKDPGNMGTIIRTADWFGIPTIYHTPESVDIYNPKVIQATMGSFFRVHFEETNISELANLNLIGATLNGENLNDFKIPENFCLVIGNESKGIQESSIPYLKNQVRIPGIGKAESLNASIAAGILMHQFSLA